jgi:predicted metalloprotease with PDZ domain
LLDLEIRARTQGQKSLDDVMRYLYHHVYESPAATYYAPGRGFEESDLLLAVNTVSGGDFSSFFEQYVRGTAPLPYAGVLALAGVELEVSAAPGAAPSIGVSTQLEDRGLRITSIAPGSAAERAGLSRDDLLLSVDELSLSNTSLNDRLKIYPPGSEVPFAIERHLKQERITVTLDPPLKDRFSIEEIASATAGEKTMRDAWLAPPK